MPLGRRVQGTQSLSVCVNDMHVDTQADVRTEMRLAWWLHTRWKALCLEAGPHSRRGTSIPRGRHAVGDGRYRGRVGMWGTQVDAQAFCFAVWRPDHYPDGTLSIEQLPNAGGSAGARAPSLRSEHADGRTPRGATEGYPEQPSERSSMETGTLCVVRTFSESVFGDFSGHADGERRGLD